MKVRIDGNVAEYETIEELEDAIDSALEDEYEVGKDTGYDQGFAEGEGEGYSDAKKEYERAIPDDRRAEEMRLDLYRAIYAGDMEKAEDMANLMSMVDIDRELIWQARREIRKS